MNQEQRKKENAELEAANEAHAQGKADQLNVYFEQIKMAPSQC